MGYIYIIENLLNNKKYIGKTIRNPQIRWKEHIKDNRHKNLPLQKAFDKYGINNFSFKILEECKNEKLNEREIFYIQKYDSYNNGYNATIGGDGGNCSSLKKEEIQQILFLWGNGKTPNEIIKLTNHSLATIKKYLFANGITKKDYFNRVRIKINKNFKQTRKKGDLFYKISEQERDIILKYYKYGYSFTDIANFTNHTLKAIKLFLSNYYTEKELSERKISKITSSKIYLKKDLEGKLIKKYNNRLELEKDYSSSQIKVIQNCARGVKNTAYGYKWSYE